MYRVKILGSSAPTSFLRLFIPASYGLLPMVGERRSSLCDEYPVELLLSGRAEVELAELLMVRILVVDDRADIRQYVRTYVETQLGWEVCGEAADGEQAVDIASTLRPNIIILDVHMQRMTGYDAARQILKTSPNILILILSLHDDVRHAEAARDCGAHGFLAKSDADEFLIPAISALLRGELYFPQLATNEL
jgi:CheY-like chemotaxis protein